MRNVVIAVFWVLMIFAGLNMGCTEAPDWCEHRVKIELWSEHLSQGKVIVPVPMEEHDTTWFGSINDRYTVREGEAALELVNTSYGVGLSIEFRTKHVKVTAYNTIDQVDDPDFPITPSMKYGNGNMYYNDAPQEVFIEHTMKWHSEQSYGYYTLNNQSVGPGWGVYSLAFEGSS